LEKENKIMRKKNQNKFRINVVLSGILFGIFALTIINGCTGSKKDKKVQKKIFPVEVKIADKGNIEQRFEFTGTIDAWKKLNLIPDVGGKISKIFVNIGERVSKGDILSELEQKTFLLRLEQAEAGYAVAEAGFVSAEKNYQRALQLKKEESMSTQQFEQIETGYQSAKAQLKSATASLDLAKWQVDVSVIKAPFSGVITAKYLNEGDMINPQMPGAPGIVQLMDLSKLKIQVFASEKEIAQIKKGQKAIVYPDALPDMVVYGKVANVNMAANPATRTFLVEISVLNKENILKAGMFSRVEIIVNEKQGTIIVPSDAVLGRVGDYHVFVVHDKKAVRQSVKPGIKQDNFMEILDGLATGDSVIVTGQDIVQHGSSVIVSALGGK